MQNYTINSKTVYPAHHSLLSVTVIADDCISANAYAASFMVMGLERMDAFLIFSQPDGTYDVGFSKGFRNFLTEL